jgi:hypothetical protein
VVMAVLSVVSAQRTEARAKPNGNVIRINRETLRFHCETPFTAASR